MKDEHMEGIEKVYHIHLRQSGNPVCIIKEEEKSGKETDKYRSSEVRNSIRKVLKETKKEIDRLIGENVIFYTGSDYEFDVFHVRRGSKVGVHKVDDDYCLHENPMHEIEGEKFYPFTRKQARYVKRFFKDAFKNPALRK